MQHYVNYQQDDWTEWLSTAYNDKRHMTTDHILFELNFGKHPWKGDLTIKMELPKVRRLPRRTIGELGCSKAIDENNKRSHEITIWQEEIKTTRTEGRW